MMMMNAIQFTPNRNPENTLEWLAWSAFLADSKKALDVTLLETKNVTQIADYFLIVTGESRAQVRAITEEIKEQFKHAGLPHVGDERDANASWCLLDYGDFVIHVMQPEQREFYNLEGYWNHAEVIETETWHGLAKSLGLNWEIEAA
ncbi:MAG: ribosome silencing factor [Candidatus Melainabacteria bacterium]|jgi:ribosome-associated protein|nr:ribosome silencing factor [Candidatus Melainabacteria bacterium]